MKIKGNLQIKVLTGNEIKEYNEHNTTTKLLEHIILSSSIGALISSNTGSELGTSYLNFPMRQGSMQGYAMTSTSTSDLITIYLLNLTTEEQANLTKTIKKNPVIGSNMFLNDDALIGYATCSYGGTADKEGTISPPKASIGIDANLFPIAFKWVPGKMNGTINTIIIGTNVISDPAHSISLARGVDVNNPVLNESNSQGYYLTAGCSTPEGGVLTANNEILLGNGEAPTKARRCLNLETGLDTELQTTDPRYNHTLYSGGQQYYIGEGRIAVQRDSYVYIYNLATDAQIKAISSVRGFAIYNNFIYVKNSSRTAPKFEAYNMEDLSRVSASDISITLPSSITDFDAWYLSNFSEGQFLLTKQISTSSPPDLDLDSSIVFSDLNSPFTSFTGGYIGQIGSAISFGKQSFYISNLAQEVYKKNNITDQIFSISGELINCIRQGVKITDLTTDYGQVLTYATLSQPITITPVNGFEITYYFNI